MRVPPYLTKNLKTLKRLAFGFRSFSAFRARILLAARTHPYI